jgi:hypothetical protein
MVCPVRATVAPSDGRSGAWPSAASGAIPRTHESSMSRTTSPAWVIAASDCSGTWTVRRSMSDERSR